MTDNIILIKKTCEMELYDKNADVYLFPSNYEGRGITLIEAQVSGLKCLASDVVLRESQCGLLKYKPLCDGYFKWGDLLELFNGDVILNKMELIMI